MKIRQEIVNVIYCYYTISLIIRNCQRKLNKLSKENLRTVHKMGKLWKRLIKNISEGIAKSVIVVDVIKLMWDCHTEPRTLEMSK